MTLGNVQLPVKGKQGTGVCDGYSGRIRAASGHSWLFWPFLAHGKACTQQTSVFLTPGHLPRILMLVRSLQEFRENQLSVQLIFLTFLRSIFHGYKVGGGDNKTLVIFSEISILCQ